MQRFFLYFNSLFIQQFPKKKCEKLNNFDKETFTKLTFNITLC